MSNDADVYSRILKLFIQVMKLVMDGKRDPHKIAEMLQEVLVEQARSFELYLFGKQKTGGVEIGFDIEAHLKETELIKRVLSLESPFVQGWLADPNTYPEELKGKAIFLWGSQRGSGDDRGVAYLIWDDGRVIVYWPWLGSEFDGSDPALLASS